MLVTKAVTWTEPCCFTFEPQYIKKSRSKIDSLLICLSFDCVLPTAMGDFVILWHGRDIDADGRYRGQPNLNWRLGLETLTTLNP